MYQLYELPLGENRLWKECLSVTNKEQAIAAVKSRVLEQPHRDRRQSMTTEEDERRIIRELASDQEGSVLSKLKVSPTRPQQEVNPNRRSLHESRSEPALSPKRQVYVEERDKAAAARAALVVEKLKRIEESELDEEAILVEKLKSTEESELDEEAILDDKDEPQIDFAGEREHSEGEVHSDDETTSVMETDPPATASQRTPEISDVRVPRNTQSKQDQEKVPTIRDTSNIRQSTPE